MSIPEKRDATASDRWQAVLRRDPAAEGRFVYAVTTTGIFCRPTCSSRRPRRENVTFFDTVDGAETAGFRACKRCRPKEVSVAQRVVSQVQEILDAAETAPTLAELAEQTGLSPFHLQRVFKRATGLSPKQYAVALRQKRLQAALKEGKSVTTALYDAGFGSSHALYAKTSERLGMRPRAYQQGGRGERIAFGHFDTAYGPLFLAATERGLVAAGFGDPGRQRASLRQEFPAAILAEDAEALEAYRERIADYLEGGAPGLDLSLDLAATEFQRQVWQALRQIPRGETRSYGQVAEMIGQPKAVRAVARACATNPVALVIPCHRVVLASGKAGGYRWGTERKRRLLEEEQGR